MLCDCIEVTRAGGKNSEGILTMVLLVSTLLLLCKVFINLFSSEGPNYTMVLAM